jgi:ribosomal protein L14E/L6E/L27E
VEKLLDKTQVGRLVYSKAGRDAGSYYVIISVIDHQYVCICNGDTRKIEKPKKKKVKHLKFTSIYSEEIYNAISLGVKVNNSYIKKFVKSEGINKEV